MTSRRWVWLLCLGSCFLLSLPVGAQRLTGTLIGSVKDEQHGALPGAIVRVTSPALVGGALTATTDDRGQWRFPTLAPGSYILTVELAQFAPYREDHIEIGAGTTFERTIVLSLGMLSTSVSVEGAGSRLDARESGFSTRTGPEDLRTIPTRRFSMFDSIKTAPGISPTSPSSGTVPTVSAFGSGVNENAFLIDGTNFTCPCQGVSRAEPSVDVIHEVQVQSVGASVEYGNIQGAVFNVVTKHGGDLFQYDASYYGQWAGMTAQPVERPIPGRGGATSGYERTRYRDFTTNLGGPIVRQHLWFFGGYQYLRDYDSQPGVDPAFPRRYEQNKVFGKATWRISPTLQLMTTVHQERWVNPTPPTAVTPFEATLRVHATVPAMTFGHLTHVLSPNTVWDVRVGRFTVAQKQDPNSGDRTASSRFDQATGVTSGNPAAIGAFNLDRITVKAVLNHHKAAWLGGNHDMRAGVEVESGEHRAPSAIPGGVRYVDNAGAPFQAVYRAPATEGGRFQAVALFASDSVTLRDAVTINAGLRFDHSRAISADVPAVDTAGVETDDIVKGLGTLYTWNILSPRLGATARLTADGRTMLRASYGRFHQGMLTGEMGANHPGLTPTTTMRFDPETGDYTTLVSVVDPRRNIVLDPETGSPRTDEYSIGVDRQVASRVSAAVAYIRKRGGNFVGWNDVGGEYRQETRLLEDGTSLPVFVLTNSAADRRFLLTNPDGFSLAYDGIVVAVDKRMSDGWRLFGSYTFSRTSGLMASSNAMADGAQLSTVAPVNTFGRDPNDRTNAGGRLPNDRPHLFRMMGVVNVPRIGVVVAANLQQASGKPWAATTQMTLPQGSQRILIEPRGTRRLSSQTLLDVRFSKAIPMGGAGQVEVLFDVLNLLNDAAEEALATDNRFGATFGVPTAFVDPRRAMLSVRLNLGR